MLLRRSFCEGEWSERAKVSGMSGSCEAKRAARMTWNTHVSASVVCCWAEVRVADVSGATVVSATLEDVERTDVAEGTSSVVDVEVVEDEDEDGKVELELELELELEDEALEDEELELELELGERLELELSRELDDGGGVVVLRDVVVGVVIGGGIVVLLLEV